MPGWESPDSNQPGSALVAHEVDAATLPIVPLLDACTDLVPCRFRQALSVLECLTESANMWSRLPPERGASRIISAVMSERRTAQSLECRSHIRRDTHSQCA